MSSNLRKGLTAAEWGAAALFTAVVAACGTYIKHDDANHAEKLRHLRVLDDIGKAQQAKAQVVREYWRSRRDEP